MYKHWPAFHTTGGRPLAISHDAAGDIQVNGRTITKVVRAAQGVALYCGADVYLVSREVYRQIRALPVVPYSETPSGQPPEPWAELVCDGCGTVFRFEGDVGWAWSNEEQEWQHRCGNRVNLLI